MLVTIQRLVSSDIIDRATNKIPHLIVLRLLKLLSSRCFENDDGTRQMENEAFFKGIQWVADQVMAGKGKEVRGLGWREERSDSALRIPRHLQDLTPFWSNVNVTEGPHLRIRRRQHVVVGNPLAPQILV